MIYVDMLVRYGWVMRGRSIASCHLLADSVEELVEFAKGIGMKERWLQKSVSGTWHFDLTSKRRDAAVLNGAKELTRRELCDLLKKHNKL